MLRSLSILAPLALAAGSSAQSTDYHVDVVNGSNTTGNGTLAAPWKTITHAVNATSGFRRIVAAAGEYSSASGEVFPLALPSQVTLRGAGRDRTVLRGTSGQVLVMPASAAGLPVDHPLLEGVTLTGPAHGVLITAPGNPLGIVDVEFDDLTTGLWLLEDGGQATISARSCDFHDCSLGVHLDGFGHLSAVLDDCRLAANVVAVQLFMDGSPADNPGQGQAYLNRCNVVQNFLALQVAYNAQQDAEVRFTNSLVANNGSVGTCLAPFGGPFSANNLIESFWSTIVDNANFLTVPAHGETVLTAWGSILWNTGPTVDPDLAYHAWKTNTNLPLSGDLVTSLDPQFDPLAPGQYRLSATSPLVDAHPTYGYPQPTTDIEGDPRTLDFGANGGNVVDVGWDERTSLLLLASGPAQLGSSVELTTHAPAPLPVAAFLSPATAQVPLDAGNWLMIQLAPAVLLGAGIAPSTKSLAIPADPALSGLRVWVQSGGLSGAQVLTSNRAELALF